MMIKENKKIILAMDFIGKKINVTASDCESLVGKIGTVVDETKNIFVVNHDGRDFRLLKSQIHFRIQGVETEIDGKKISRQMDERLKGKL